MLAAVLQCCHLHGYGRVYSLLSIHTTVAFFVMVEENRQNIPRRSKLGGELQLTHCLPLLYQRHPSYFYNPFPSSLTSLQTGSPRTALPITLQLPPSHSPVSLEYWLFAPETNLSRLLCQSPRGSSIQCEALFASQFCRAVFFTFDLSWFWFLFADSCFVLCFVSDIAVFRCFVYLLVDPYPLSVFGLGFPCCFINSYLLLHPPSAVLQGNMPKPPASLFGLNPVSRVTKYVFFCCCCCCWDADDSCKWVCTYVSHVPENRRVLVNARPRSLLINWLGSQVNCQDGKSDLSKKKNPQKPKQNEVMRLVMWT